MESFYLVGPNPEQSTVFQQPASDAPVAALPAQAPEEPGGPRRAILATEDRATAHSQSPPAAPGEGLTSATDHSHATLVSENKRLVRLVQTLTERIRTLESAAHENSMLKSSIFNFREEFQRHANAVTLPVIHEAEHETQLEAEATAASPAAEAQVRLLEEELQKAQLEGAKQRAQVAKYRDRWEKLKESAKRKRQQQGMLTHDHRQGPAA
ncbi:hypothetical protein LPJ61_000273 [Coemansia biformis]|uniref:Uncharacterized protein n=1 Tax=Coemansia biformis TaxID=1286918 RepID=A0A9W7YIY1_9FUNG|nr:hypothetical protein LPJ61_000273 [Coemansia biformis]